MYLRCGMRAVAPLLAVVVCAGLAAAGGDGATAKPRLRVAFVAVSGTVPTERELFGASLLGFERAVKKFGVDGRVVYVPPNRDAGAPLRSLARQKYDLVVVGTPQLTPLEAVAKEFPDVKFLVQDGPLAGFAHPPSTMEGTLVRASEAAYLAGYLAALMESRRPGKHVVSAVGGFKVEGVDRWIDGFEAGAKRADPHVT